MGLDDYLAELTRRLRDVLGDELLGVYAGGSYALGAYEPGRSDIDVTAVAAGPLAPAAKQAIVERAAPRGAAVPRARARARRLPARHRALGRRRARLRAQPQHRRGRWRFRVDEEPGEIEGFWFAIDRAILREHGVALAGPPPAELFAPIPRATLLPLLAGVGPLAPRQRRPARHGRRPQHLPRAALRGRGDVVVQARGGRLGRRRADRARGARGRGARPRRGRAIPRRCGRPP